MIIPVESDNIFFFLYPTWLVNINFSLLIGKYQIWVDQKQGKLCK